MGMCKGKSAFETHDIAEQALHSIKKNRRDKREQTPCRFYKCDICHKYHLTSQPYAQTLVPARLKHAKEFAKYIQ